MLEQPELDDTLLIAGLYDGYGLRISRLVFLPLGVDVNTAVYRAEADDGRAYFLKLRRGPWAETSVTIPAWLSEQGIGQIIAPLRATNGALWTTLDPFTVILYPFIEGVDGYAVDLTERQLIEVGTALKRMHTASLPEALRRGVPQETYTPYWREQVRAFQAQLSSSTFEDPIASGLAALLKANSQVVDELVDGADRLGQVLIARPSEDVLCHADLHAGNLFISPDGSLYIVDWDTVLLAPKERDLMFVGSGLGRTWDKAREAAWFYQGYGPTAIDPVGLAYYRCERVVQDIAAFCEQILTTTSDGPDRRQALHYLAGSFRPGNAAEVALRSYRAAPERGGPVR